MQVFCIQCNLVLPTPTGVSKTINNFKEGHGYSHENENSCQWSGLTISKLQSIGLPSTQVKFLWLLTLHPAWLQQQYQWKQQRWPAARPQEHWDPYMQHCNCHNSLHGTNTWKNTLPNFISTQLWYDERYPWSVFDLKISNCCQLFPYPYMMAEEEMDKEI